VAVAIAGRLLSRRHPHLAYALWIVVLLKSVTPPIWTSPSGIFFDRWTQQIHCHRIGSESWLRIWRDDCQCANASTYESPTGRPGCIRVDSSDDRHSARASQSAEVLANIVTPQRLGSYVVPASAEANEATTTRIYEAAEVIKRFADALGIEDESVARRDFARFVSSEIQFNPSRRDAVDPPSTTFCQGDNMVVVATAAVHERVKELECRLCHCGSRSNSGFQCDSAHAAALGP